MYIYSCITDYTQIYRYVNACMYMPVCTCVNTVLLSSQRLVLITVVASQKCIQKYISTNRDASDIFILLIQGIFTIS